jgi:chemotaxis protein methyltransferase CheR
MKTLAINDRQRALQDITILAETARDPFLILDTNLKVVGTNQPFYETFKVSKEETKGKQVYDLGSGQWDIAKLRQLLENILPQKKVFRDFEVKYSFPKIGQRVFILNAQRLDTVKLIILSFEDITVKRTLEEKLANYTSSLEKKVAEQTKELSAKVRELEKSNKNMVGRELKMVELKKEIESLKKK